MARTKKENGSSSSTANIGFEAKLWLAADKLRNNMDAAEYKHVVLGLIFLKYISDTFEEHRAKLLAGEGDYAGANPEDPDEYKAENVFWVPADARWSHLQASAKQPTIGKTVDDAMVAIERDNPRLKGVLPKDYARPGLDKHRLGELIDLIATISLTAASEGEKTHRSVDLLGRVYEYFLTRFASAEGKNGGQFYTPSCVVRLLVEMLAPHPNSRIYDPCCGSGGMFVQSEKFIETHGGRPDQVAIYGQESNATTRRLAVMNLAIRGITADFGPEHADTFRRDLHPDLRADYVLANPPFNDSDWFRKDDDVRWQFGVPPKGNANFAWVQHFIHHLAPQGMAGFVLANGSMSSNQSGEGDIRRALIEADLVDCMVALPGQLFYSTPIKVCLWFLAKDKNDGKRRDRRRQTLFIDAQEMGSLLDRVHRELTDSEIKRIVDTYHAWRGESKTEKYKDVHGFCRSSTTSDIAKNRNILTPGDYVGSLFGEIHSTPLAARLQPLTANLKKERAIATELNARLDNGLLAAHFVEVAKAEYTDSWKEQSLDEIATFLNGLALQKYPPGDGPTLPVIKIAQLRAGHTQGADLASAEIPAPYIVEDGDVLFSWSGSLEVEIWCGGKGALNQHLFKVTSDAVPKWFYYLWTLYHLPRFRSIAANKATTMGHIQRHHLTEAKVLVPPPDIMARLGGIFEPLIEKEIACKRELNALSLIRSALLPKLLSGDVAAS